MSHTYEFKVKFTCPNPVSESFDYNPILEALGEQMVFDVNQGCMEVKFFDESVTEIKEEEKINLSQYDEGYLMALSLVCQCLQTVHKDDNALLLVLNEIVGLTANLTEKYIEKANAA